MPDTLAARKSSIPIKSIALPIEHGAWGFLFEPLLAGVILAPSLAALFLFLLYIGLFLARQPLKLALADLLKRRRLPRTAPAIRFTLIFGCIAAIGTIGSAATAPYHVFVPFGVVGPLAIYLIVQDVARQSRELWPELLAAFALASSISVITLAGGWTYAASLSLWLVMLARLIPSVLYVRSRLRLEKGKDFSAVAPLVTHIAGLVAVSCLTYLSLASVLTVAMSAFLAVRAALGLSGYRRALKARQIGVLEVIYGILYALTIVVGHFIGY